MKKRLRKLLVIVVLFMPMFINTDCKKQKRCGCRGDVLYPIAAESYVYFTDESPIITMTTTSDYYSYYTFCNPDEIMPKLANFKNGDVLVVSGDVFWDCNYVMQSSSGSYSAYSYRAYSIYVTDVYMDMYGKDDSDETLKGAN